MIKVRLKALGNYEEFGSDRQTDCELVSSHKDIITVEKYVEDRWIVRATSSKQRNWIVGCWLYQSSTIPALDLKPGEQLIDVTFGDSLCYSGTSMTKAKKVFDILKETKERTKEKDIIVSLTVNA